MCDIDGKHRVDCLECWEREMLWIGSIEELLYQLDNNIPIKWNGE